MKTYWWGGNPAGIKNFGDRLTGLLLMAMGANPRWVEPHQADLVVVGSLLEHLPPRWPGIVCGAGLLHEASRLDLSHATVLALRGKLTASRVRGCKSPVLGDPGLLVSLFMPQPLAKYDLGVVPHWSDTELRERYPHAHYIDVRDHPEKVVAEIARCKRIISSSLHGLIVADAYGIPRQAELFPNASKPCEGGDFKFRDYASLYDGIPHFGQMWKAPHHQVAQIQEGLMRALCSALGLAAPPPVPAPTPTWRSCRRPQISLLVPFRDDGEHRTRVWKWLKRFWAYHLPSVEIVMGHDHGTPFSKAAAVNDAASRALGRVFVILDADAFLDPAVIQDCADAIDDARMEGQRLWFMPYNKLYRLNETATLELLFSDPSCDYDIISPPSESWLEPGRAHDYGHQYGAMIQIMPKEAFFAAGGMDPRFRGWGSEDGSMMRAVDTLYAPHELIRNDVLHLWHERPGTNWHTRRWIGQRTGGAAANARLAQRYIWATGEPGWMAALVDEHAQPTPRRRRRFCCCPRR